jgi:hypothetical protein
MRLAATSFAFVMTRSLALRVFRQLRAGMRGARVDMQRLFGLQVATFAREDNEASLLVLRGHTVWSLSVNRTDGIITAARAAAELRRLAPKQAARVGAG